MRLALYAASTGTRLFFNLLNLCFTSCLSSFIIFPKCIERSASSRATYSQWVLQLYTTRLFDFIGTFRTFFFFMRSLTCVSYCMKQQEWSRNKNNILIMMSPKAFRRKKSGHSSGPQDIEPLPWAHIIDQPAEIPEEESHLSPFYTRWYGGRPKSPKSAAEKLVSKMPPDRHQAGRMQRGD